ncbi:MAG: glycosyl hydrolase family 18 protein [Bacteroidia bacterium]
MRQTLLLFLLVGSFALQAQSPKVIGYLPYYRFALKDQIPFDKLTHLNLSFLNPDTLGNWSIGNADVSPVIQQARLLNPNIKIYISVAGGALTAEWEAAYDKFMQPAEMPGFVHSLMVYAEQYQLDGLDIDLEWSHVNALYSPFVLALRDSVDTHGLGLTAALPGTYRYPDISSQALAAYDWINLMAYDLTGSWAPNNPGPHSPYSFAQQSITYWQGQGLTQSTMVLGVPFYGYDFSSGGSSFTYGSMVAEDTSYAQLDQVGQRYYNGIPTIRSKTALALQSCDGIMIWELGQDAFGERQSYSLLSTIDESINISSAIGDDLLSSILVGPNPFQTSFNIYKAASSQPIQWTLWDLQGKMIQQGSIQASSTQSNILVTDLPSGVYTLRLNFNDRSFHKKLIKY